MKHRKLVVLIALAVSATAALAATPDNSAPAGMPAMMQTMRAAVERIAATPDAAQRQKLADQLIQTMPGQCQGMMGAGHGMMMSAPAAK
ncbi:MAG: hypothetical protein JO171_17650 [Paludibacterium sp.]|uniref:hypothetical protein n=1 Tax=Paludibacterium sp. TaxID=1917523 RepID=UPI0025F360C6|nr:hypothetical protein [Paludibacterium sp.]MBV8048979.1 hypothetical protein [Paludibacterium sp.]MBV8646577.1 hypothetical protein [Paludibacterium sp.]